MVSVSSYLVSIYKRTKGRSPIILCHIKLSSVTKFYKILTNVCRSLRPRVKLTEKIRLRTVFDLTGTRNRKRRQTTVSVNLVDLAEYVCPGGKSNVAVWEIGWCLRQGKRWTVKCKITGNPCYWIVTCNSFDQCHNDHLRSQTFCCEYLCE